MAVSSDPVPDRLENITDLFLKCNDKILAQNKADLLRADLSVLCAFGAFLEGDKEMLLEILQFGALSRRDDVFQKKGMQAETLADFFDDLDIVNAVDVNPGDGRGPLSGPDIDPENQDPVR